MKRHGMSLIMHACPRCGGAAYLEDPTEGDWRCLQCARPIAVTDVEAKKASPRAA